MIKRVPYFPDGVKVTKKSIYDYDLDVHVPINETAYMMLRQVDGVKNLDEYIDHLQRQFQVERTRIANDSFMLLQSLNQKHLINWKYEAKSKLLSKCLPILFQYQRKYAHRFTCNYRSLAMNFIQLCWIVFKKIALFWGMCIILCLGSYAFLEKSIILTVCYLFSVIYISIIVSFALHEAIHVYLHRWGNVRKGGGYIAADWLSVKFVRPLSIEGFKNRWYVTLFGPLIPGIVGVLGLFITNMWLSNSVFFIELNCIFSIFTLHLLHLLPFFGDGKSLLKQKMVQRGGF
jgi:Coenzyme PQQ synthesis protein D (PqqD)